MDLAIAMLMLLGAALLLLAGPVVAILLGQRVSEVVGEWRDRRDRRRDAEHTSPPEDQRGP